MRLGHAVRVDRSRMYLLGAAAVGAIVVVVVLIVVATGGSSGTSASAGTTATGTTATGTTPRRPGCRWRGSRNTATRSGAPLRRSRFRSSKIRSARIAGSGTSARCRRSCRDYVRTGKVKLVYRGINIIGPNSENGLRANYAAGEQNRLWQMSDELYARQGEENSGWINDATIASAAKAAGVNVDSLSAALSTAPVTKMLKNADAAATRYAVAGTPTFIVQAPPALPTQLQLSALDPASFSAALDPLLQ